MKKLLLAVLFFPLFLSAQTESAETGIKWTTGLSWEQVKQKAKAENKYIFIDCYTTWCGPCKMMDKEVFIHDSVGLLFNDKFISVKVQMDRTKNDDAFVQTWYNEADAIGKQYRIEGFPSFVFLAPNGTVTHKYAGYTTVKNFIEIAQVALKPGQVYNDPYAEYNSLVADYKKGIVNYDRMFYMISYAKSIDPALVPELTKLYREYINKLDPEQQFTKDIIGFESQNVLNSSSEYFPFFYENEKRIDEVMKSKGYAASVIDKAIHNEIVIPFFNEQNKNPIIPMKGMILGGIKPDYSEADWKKLDKMIREKFNKSIAKRNVLKSRVEWYTRHFNLESASRTQLILLEKYTSDLVSQSVAINSGAWDAFEKVSDRKILNGYIKWMEKIVRISEIPQFIDTYACLLYKVGEKGEAIVWESKAADRTASYKEVVEQMKLGEPVYGVKPLK